MRRYISLLLLIGLAWGQEYDPETGEVVIKQYDPETGELIKDQNYPDSLVSPSHPKVNSDLKNISISHLTKEQKKKYYTMPVMTLYPSRTLVKELVTAKAMITTAVKIL